MKFLYGLVSPNFCAWRSVMMLLNLSESLAKPLVMAKLNMAYLSSSKNQQNCCRPTCRCHHLGYCARRSVMMILNFSESFAKPLVMAKLNMAYLSSLKNQQNCCRPTCRCHHLGYSVPRHFTVPFGAEAPSDHVVQA